MTMTTEMELNNKMALTNKLFDTENIIDTSGVTYAENTTLYDNIILRTWVKVLAAVLLSAVTAFALLANTMFLPPVWVFLLLLVGVIIFNIYVGIKITQISPIVAYVCLAVNAIFMGLILALALARYDPISAIVAFLSAGGLFAGLSVVGFITRKNLAKLGYIATIALIVLVIVEAILGFFVHSSTFTMIVSAISLIIFACLTAHDAQMLKNLPADGSRTAENMSTLIALSLFLDFINIFLDILQLLGNRR